MRVQCTGSAPVHCTESARYNVPHCPPGDQSEARKSMTTNHSPPWGAVRVCPRAVRVQCGGSSFCLPRLERNESFSSSTPTLYLPDQSFDGRQSIWRSSLMGARGSRNTDPGRQFLLLLPLALGLSTVRFNLYQDVFVRKIHLIKVPSKTKTSLPQKNIFR